MIATKTRTKTFPIENKYNDATNLEAQFDIRPVASIEIVRTTFLQRSYEVVVDIMLNDLNIGGLILSTDDTDMGYGYDEKYLKF